MTYYARIDPKGSPEVRDLPTPPPAIKGWVPVVLVAPPVPAATQTVVDTGLVFTANNATQTWALRNKTPEELDFDATNAEKAKLADIIADVTTQRAVDRTTWDGYTANQLRAEQWRDRQVLLRVANLLLKNGAR